MRLDLLFRRNHLTDLRCELGEWFQYVMGFRFQNIRGDYRFCCFNINKLSCFVIFKKVSCTADSLVPYLDVG